MPAVMTVSHIAPAPLHSLYQLLSVSCQWLRSHCSLWASLLRHGEHHDTSHLICVQQKYGLVAVADQLLVDLFILWSCLCTRASVGPPFLGPVHWEMKDVFMLTKCNAHFETTMWECMISLVPTSTNIDRKQRVWDNVKTKLHGGGFCKGKLLRIICIF